VLSLHGLPLCPAAPPRRRHPLLLGVELAPHRSDQRLALRPQLLALRLHLVERPLLLEHRRLALEHRLPQVLLHLLAQHDEPLRRSSHVGRQLGECAALLLQHAVRGALLAVQRLQPLDLLRVLPVLG